MSVSLLLITAGCAKHRSVPPGLPPPFEASLKGNTTSLRELLDHGTPVEGRDPHGRTALHWAAIGGQVNTVTLLLDRGADVDARAEFGMTPLHWAALAGKADLADLLLRRGANPKARNGYGMTPLHEAATPEVARVLIARGASAQERDYSGMTPLHLAITGKVARALLEAGADPFARALDGRRPMDMATGADWERDGLVVYASRASARLREEEGEARFEIRNIWEVEAGPLSFSAQSPGCDVKVSPPSLARLDPGQLFPFFATLRRRAGVPEGEYPLQIVLSRDDRPLARLELRVDTSRSVTPEDRGMMRLGKATLRSAPSRLQYLAFAAVPLLLCVAWILRRGRKRSRLSDGPPSAPGA